MPKPFASTGVSKGHAFLFAFNCYKILTQGLIIIGIYYFVGFLAPTLVNVFLGTIYLCRLTFFKLCEC